MSKRKLKKRMAFLVASSLTVGVLSGTSAPIANSAAVAVGTANAAVAANLLQVSTAVAGAAVADGTSAAAKSLGLTFYNDSVGSTATTVARMASTGVLSLYTGAATGTKALITVSGGTLSGGGVAGGGTLSINTAGAGTPAIAVAGRAATSTGVTSTGILWTPGAAGTYTITLHTGAGLTLANFASTGGTLVTTLTVYVGEAYLTLGDNGAASTDTQGVITTSTALSTTVALGTSTIASTTATGKMFLSGQISGNTSPGLATSAVVVSGGTIASCSTTTNTVTLSTDKTTCSSNGADVSGISFVVRPSAVGTNLVIQGKTTNSSATWATGSQITISVVANSTANVFSASDSFLSTEVSATAATNNVDATYTSAAGVTLIPATTVINGGAGYFGFDVKDSNGVRLVGALIQGTVTGPCVINAAADSAGVVASAVTTTANSYFRIDQATANAPSTCTLTVSVNGATVATRTYTIVGQLASISVRNQSIVPATGVAVNNQLYADAKDSAGNLLDNVTIVPVTAYYNNALTTVSNITTKPGGTAAADSASNVTCSSAGTYKMQLAAVNASVATILSPVFEIVCGGAVVNYTASLDKASYVPGDIAVLTIKATDSKKLTAHDANYLGGLVADGTGTTNPVSISGSNMTAVTAPASTDLFVSGVKTYRFVVGATEGSYNMVVDLPKFNSTTYNQAAQTVAYTIKSSTATVTNAEVLASIVKLIASINKQIRALQKSLRR